MSIQPSEKDKLTSVIQAIEDNPSQANTTTQLARLAGISPLRIRQIFKQYTGQSVQQFLTAAKMKKAAALLMQDVTIKEISLSVGYSDITSFYRTFSKYYRCTPLQFRKRKLNL